jgi:hypothetical protein
VNHWPQFLRRIFALVSAPGFADLEPAEQDRLYEQVARATRAERLLAKSLPPHLFYRRMARRQTGDPKNRPSGGPL